MMRSKPSSSVAIAAVAAIVGVYLLSLSSLPSVPYRITRVQPISTSASTDLPPSSGKPSQEAPSSTSNRLPHPTAPAAVKVAEGAGTPKTEEPTIVKGPQPAAEGEPVAPSEKTVDSDRDERDLSAKSGRVDVDDPDEVEEEDKAGNEDGTQPVDADGAISGPRCIFYDRPPRTGSTTISRALEACLRERGYVQPKGLSRSRRPFHVAAMLNLTTDRIGVYGRHLYMNATDVTRMRKFCGKLLFVTSNKPLRDRMWSAAKHITTRGGKELDYEKASQIIGSRGSRMENYLEHYPYFSPDMVPLKVKEEERLVPDFVVRSERMNEDLGALLKALQCEEHFETQNTRQADARSSEFLKTVKLKMDDETYVRLEKRALEANEAGLRKARTFRR